MRPIDGFVYAISPFNFTALAVNLVMAPIIMGNVVLWKPSPGAIYSSWLFNQIMIEAGLPAGVLQFLPGDADVVTQAVFSSRDLGGLHFTGSTVVFKSLLAQIGSKMDFWKSYPRVVGETGITTPLPSPPLGELGKVGVSRLTVFFDRGQKLPSDPPVCRRQERRAEDGASSIRVPGAEMQCLVSSLRARLAGRGIQTHPGRRNRGPVHGRSVYRLHRARHQRVCL